MQKTIKIGHVMHGHGAHLHLSTLCLHRRVHNMFEQLFATYFEALRRLVNRLCYLRAYKIGYNWLQSATIGLFLVLCASREAQPCLNISSVCLLGAHGSHLNKNLVLAFKSCTHLIVSRHCIAKSNQNWPFYAPSWCSFTCTLCLHLGLCFACPQATCGLQLEEDTVPVFTFLHMYTRDCSRAL